MSNPYGFLVFVFRGICLTKVIGGKTADGSLARRLLRSYTFATSEKSMRSPPFRAMFTRFLNDPTS